MVICLIRTNIIIVIYFFFFSAVEPCLALSLLFFRTRDFYLEKLLLIEKIGCVATISTENVQTILFFFFSVSCFHEMVLLTRDRISFGGFVCLSDPFWSQACCASHHIFAANATMPQIHGTSYFVALFLFISYFVFPVL